jgi:LmbE family N-acetylglucosaminyl deacetylase
MCLYSYSLHAQIGELVEHRIIENKKDTILIISPHPDDGEIFAGGSIIKHIKNNDYIVEVFITSGEKAKRVKNISDEELAIIREEEATKVANYMHINEIIFLKFPDGAVDYKNIYIDIDQLIKKYNPDIIYTSEFINPFYNHNDHIVTGKVVHDIVNSLKEKKIKLRYYDYIVKPRGNNIFIKIDINKKNEALLLYRSQYKEVILSLTLLSALEKSYGIKMLDFTSHYEAFRSEH